MICNAAFQYPAPDPPPISGGKGNGFFVYFGHANSPEEHETKNQIQFS